MSYEEIIAQYISDGDRAEASSALHMLGYEDDEIEQLLDDAEMYGATEDTEWT